MSKTAILSVRIISDAKRAVSGFAEATGGLDKLEGRVKTAATAMTAASAGVVAFAKTALDSASALEQSTGAVESVFKSQADAVKALAADAADAVGLSANQYQEFASVMGSQLKNLGVEQQALVPTTDKLITMGADLASMYGGTTADAVEALGAVFRGETDPIEKYGISIKQSDVNARLAADGLGDLEGEARKQAETQARLALLTEQSADAQGNFARETDTAAGSAQIAAAHWENAKAALGESLLPIATQAAEVMANLAQKIGENPAAVAKFAGAVLGLTGALWAGWAAIKVYRGAAAIASAVGVAWQVMTGRMVAGNVTAAASSGVAASSSAAAWIGAGLRAAGAWAVMAARAVASFVATSASAVASAAATAAAWVASTARTIAAFVAQNAAMLAARGATLAMAAGQAVLNAVMAANPIGLVITALAALAAGLVIAYNRSETFRNAIKRAGDIGRAAMDMVGNAIKSVVNAVMNVISRVAGIGPGFRSAMNVAVAAVNILLSPLRGLIGLINNVIGAIGRIRFPSPPAWMSNLFGSGHFAYGDMYGVPDKVFRFMSPPPLTAAAQPELTAASSSPALGDLVGSGALATAPQRVEIDNSVNVTVDGSGIVDPRAVADQVRRALTRDNRGRGRTTAGGATWL